jgi:RimJ/RimL family protein N-acetyltransferase
MEVGFRPLREDDLPLVHEWLRREHVRRWWGERGGLDEVIAYYGPAIEGRDPTDLYAILLGGRAAGMIQTYLVSDYPDWAAVIRVGDDVAGLDLFLSEAEHLGRGLGTEVIRAFVTEIVFARGATRACVADPDLVNIASVRAFEKAGFVKVSEFVDPEDGRMHALVRRERSDGGGALLGSRRPTSASAPTG